MPPPPRNESQIHLRLAEPGPIRREDEVAGEGQLAPGSQTKAIDGCEDWFLEVIDPVEEGLEGLRGMEGL